MRGPQFGPRVKEVWVNKRTKLKKKRSKKEAMVARRDILKATATMAAIIPVISASTSTGAQQPQAPVHVSPEAAPATTLGGIAPGPDVRLTIERRGAVVLFGLNRPHLQNRIDPETFRALARAIYEYDHDPSLRAAVLFGHGDCFSRGIDVDAYCAVANFGGPLAGLTDVINPLNYGVQRTKPLIAAVHGDTWNLAHELFLAADIRVAAADTNFGQDENSQGRFPGGGSTVRFVREAGCCNAMRYMLTGEHWSATDARRMGLVQDTGATSLEALELAAAIAGKVAHCAPLGIQTTLISAHLAIDAGEAAAFSKLGAQYGALYRSDDFGEGLAALAEG